MTDQNPEDTAGSQTALRNQGVSSTSWVDVLDVSLHAGGRTSGEGAQGGRNPRRPGRAPLSSRVDTNMGSANPWSPSEDSGRGESNLGRGDVAVPRVRVRVSPPSAVTVGLGGVNPRPPVDGVNPRPPVGGVNPWSPDAVSESDDNARKSELEQRRQLRVAGTSPSALVVAGGSNPWNPSDTSFEAAQPLRARGVADVRREAEQLVQANLQAEERILAATVRLREIESETERRVVEANSSIAAMSEAGAQAAAQVVADAAALVAAQAADARLQMEQLENALSEARRQIGQEEEARLEAIVKRAALDAEMEVLDQRRIALEVEIDALNVAASHARLPEVSVEEGGEQKASDDVLAALELDRDQVRREIAELKTVWAEARIRHEVISNEIDLALGKLESLKAEKKALREEIAGLREKSANHAPVTDATDATDATDDSDLRAQLALAVAAAAAERAEMVEEINRLHSFITNSGGSVSEQPQPINVMTAQRRRLVKSGSVQLIPVESLGKGVINTLGNGVSRVLNVTGSMVSWIVPSARRKKPGRRGALV